MTTAMTLITVEGRPELGARWTPAAPAPASDRSSFHAAVAGLVAEFETATAAPARRRFWRRVR